MATLLAFNGTVLISDTGSDATYGFVHQEGLQPQGVRVESVNTPGAAGFDVKVHAVGDSPADAFGLILGTAARRPTRIHGASRAALQATLAAIDAARAIAVTGTLSYLGVSYTNMFWASWITSGIMSRTAFAPGGTTKTHCVDIIDCRFFRMDPNA